MTRTNRRRVAATLVAAGLVATAATACRSTSVLDLTVGDCLRRSDLQPEQIENIATVSCGDPHDAEIFASTQLPEGDYPGELAVRTAAEDFCLPEFETFVGISYLDSELEVYPLMPTEDGWNSLDDREILCIVVSPTDVTGTLEGAAR